MTNIEIIKATKALKENYNQAITDVEMSVASADNEEMALAGIIKFMQNLGKNDPAKMSAAKELVAELDSL